MSKSTQLRTVLLPFFFLMPLARTNNYSLRLLEMYWSTLQAYTQKEKKRKLYARTVE